MSKRLKLIIVVISALILLSVLFMIAVNLFVVNVSEENILYDLESMPKVDAIVVLGAGLRSDGTPSDMLSDRLSTAIELYKTGISDKIILSGDCSGADYDEVGAMYSYCVEKGIPEDSLVRDNEGFSTYESIYNVIERLDCNHFIVVTQKYHLYRAVYIAQNMGADVIGVNSDPREYRGQSVRLLREYVARVKDALKVSLYQ